MAKFICPTTILTGPGSLAQLGEVVRPWGGKALVVIGCGGAAGAGLLDRVRSLLTDAGLAVDVFSGVLPEPPCRQVEQLRAHLARSASDLVVALGGGSVMDVAKAGAILHFSDKPATWHLATQKVPARALPLVALPTTAGTGSEVTSTSVLTDGTESVKRSIRGDAMMPKAAIVDPELTRSCPPAITAQAGMDALTQAIESFCSRHATNFTDALAVKAIDLVYRHLVQAFRHGEDLAARAAVAEGSMLAGLALANARLGAVHGLAHPVGGTCHLPHGLVCAILLPAVLAFNRPVLEREPGGKYGELARLLGGDPEQKTRNLLAQLELPCDFTSFRIDPALLATFAEQAMVSGSTKANPRDVTPEDVETILRPLL